MAAPPPLARRCSPRFSRQEVREPGVELRHALLRYGNRDLLVGHPLDLGGLSGLAGGLGLSLVGLASLGACLAMGAPVPVSVGVAAIVTAPSAPAATGQEPSEERVELRNSLLGNVDRDLLVL